MNQPHKCWHRREYIGSDGQTYRTAALSEDDDSAEVITYNGVPVAERGENWRAYSPQCSNCYLNQSHTVALHDSRAAIVRTAAIHRRKSWAGQESFVYSLSVDGVCQDRSILSYSTREQAEAAVLADRPLYELQP